MAHAWMIDAEGWLPLAHKIPSPNCDERPSDAAVTLLVVHNISLPPGCFSGSAVEALFLNRLDPSVHPFFKAIAGIQVSAHFFIRRRGELMQFVPCRKRAWHAGASTWRGRERCNDFSIGVELEGADDVPFTTAQYAALTRLTHALQATYPIQEVVGHSDIAPGRKTDPGPYFDWKRYRTLLDKE